MADEQSPKVPESTDAPATPTSARKPFEPPRLSVYGDITTLTRAVGRTGLVDGGHGSTARTRP